MTQIIQAISKYLTKHSIKNKIINGYAYHGYAYSSYIGIGDIIKAHHTHQPQYNTEIWYDPNSYVPLITIYKNTKNHPMEHTATLPIADPQLFPKILKLLQ
jgi:hypothetical protein